MPSQPPGIAKLIGIGSTIAALVAGGLLLGWFIDNQVGTFPILTLVGLVVGMTSAGIQLYITFRKFTQD